MNKNANVVDAAILIQEMVHSCLSCRILCLERIHGCCSFYITGANYRMVDSRSRKRLVDDIDVVSGASLPREVY